MAALLNRQQIIKLIGRGNSHTLKIPGWPVGVTKFQVFLAIRPLLSDKDYWFALREAYDMSDDLYQYREDVKFAFNADCNDKGYLMVDKELAYLRKLPEEIKIYRAMTVDELESGDFGVSWTLDKSVAAFFAEKYQRNYSTAGRPNSS